MILLYGIYEDSPISLVKDELENAGADYCFLNHRNIFSSSIECTLNEEKSAEGTIHSPGLTIDFSQVTAAYARPYNFMDYAEMKGKSSDDPLAIAAMGFENQLMSCLDASDGFIVNKSEPSASNNSKPY